MGKTRATTSGKVYRLMSGTGTAAVADTAVQGIAVENICGAHVGKVVAGYAFFGTRYWPFRGKLISCQHARLEVEDAERGPEDPSLTLSTSSLNAEEEALDRIIAAGNPTANTEIAWSKLGNGKVTVNVDPGTPIYVL
jgi:hypothetical protein